MNQMDIPQGWKKLKLKDILDEGSKEKVKDISKYQKLTIKLNFKGMEKAKVRENMADKRPFYIRKKGEIVIGKQNYFNGSIAILPEELDGGICSNAIMSFITKKDFNNKYVYYMLSDINFINKRSFFANGTGQKELSEKDFLNFDVIIPRMEEQEKIVDILEKIDIIIKKYEEINIITKKMKEAILNSIQSNNIVSLNDLCEFIKDGTHGSHKDVEDGIPLLSAKDIENGKLRIPDNCRRISEEDYKKIHKNFKIKKGDILLTIVGTIGKTAIVETENKFTLQRSVAIIRPKKYINGKYLYYYLGTKFYLRQLLFESNESAQSGVYLGSLAKSKVIKLEKDMETKFITVLEILDRKIEIITRNIEEYNKLKQGLMQQLLTGKIRVKI